MVFEHIEKLKQEYTDKYVTIGEVVPELQRFEGKTGIVRTVNMSGRALVEFLGSTDISWYDIDVDYLKIVEKPPEAVVEETPQKRVVANDATPTTPPPGKARPATTGPSTADILAMARGKKAQAAESEKPAQSPTKKPSPGKKPSTADILAMARGKGTAKQGEATKPKTDAQSLTTAEKLALLRGEKKGDAQPASEPAEQPTAEGEAKKKPSTADILAMARGKKKPATDESSQELPADGPPAKSKAKPSTADILAMARNAKKKPAEKGSQPQDDSPPPEAEDL